MAKKKTKRNVFGDAAGAAKSAPTTGPASRPNMVEQRQAYQADLSTRRKVNANILEVDPEDCVIWDKHNRRYDRLSEYSCSDLIDGIRALGRQQEPAFVRRRKVKQGPKYEGVAGARRLWTVRYLRDPGRPDLK
ncbi:MAG: ParB N-terminal domain-containing protein, partial [Pseudomonadota bacterium]